MEGLSHAVHGMPPGDKEKVFAVGEPVLYYSRTQGQWISATVRDYNVSQLPGPGEAGNSVWSYNLDVQPQASPSLVAARPSVVQAAPPAATAAASQPVTSCARTAAAPALAPVVLSARRAVGRLAPQPLQQAQRHQTWKYQQQLNPLQQGQHNASHHLAQAQKPLKYQQQVPRLKLQEQPDQAVEREQAETEQLAIKLKLQLQRLQEQVNQQLRLQQEAEDRQRQEQQLFTVAPMPSISRMASAPILPSSFSTPGAPVPMPADSTPMKERANYASVRIPARVWDVACNGRLPSCELPTSFGTPEQSSRAVAELSPSCKTQLSAGGSPSLSARDLKAAHASSLVTSAVTPHGAGLSSSAACLLSKSTPCFPGGIQRLLSTPSTPQAPLSPQPGASRLSRQASASQLGRQPSPSQPSRQASASQLPRQTSPPRHVQQLCSSHVSRQASQSEFSRPTSPSKFAQCLSASQMLSRSISRQSSESGREFSAARRISGSSAAVAIAPAAWNTSRPELQVHQVQQQMQLLQNAPTPITATPLAAQAAASSFLREQHAIPSMPIASQASSLLQLGLPPEMWGIGLGQLQEIAKNKHWQQRMDTRDVVVRVIWPATSGKGIGYALLQNQSSPLRATVMVSHAWDESFLDFLGALRQWGQEGPFWVAAVALYQSEDAIMQALRDPQGLLRHVMQRGEAMLCVQSSRCNVYKRLWCLFEMYVATSVGLEVEITRKTKVATERSKVRKGKQAKRRECRAVSTEGRLRRCLVHRPWVPGSLQRAGGLEALLLWTSWPRPPGGWTLRAGLAQGSGGSPRQLWGSGSSCRTCSAEVARQVQGPDGRRRLEQIGDRQAVQPGD
eukprot:TRINITY_DN1417_c0_g1_i3.p1 TRINITY_DN1417_c0_g1~~TRINITY_DN1417_c0_g1_i3.p1  ORF type:complete len:847 (+),score=154.04 TRINITY_DN1417_c0_g1_i3:25-2565(+)